MLDIKIAFIGSGFMARGAIRGLVESGTLSPSSVYVVNEADAAGRDEVAALYGVKAARPEDISLCDAVFFAVKPQTFETVCAEYGGFFTPDKLYLTIMAGISTAKVSHGAGGGRVVRFMPNLALSVGLSATAFALGDGCADAERRLARALFEPLGEVVEVSEDEISAVTALSGSGPAYFCYLCEGMIAAAVADGMDEAKARSLSVQTLIGTAKLIEDSGEAPGEMRRRITSKKGTTEAAIGAMTDTGFLSSIEAGYIAARDRSDELGK
jgi:pyrroline-5-carboxylate reductase